MKFKTIYFINPKKKKILINNLLKKEYLKKI